MLCKGEKLLAHARVPATKEILATDQTRMKHRSNKTTRARAEQFRRHGPFLKTSKSVFHLCFIRG